MLNLINRYRGFFIILSALIARWLFLAASFGILYLASQLDPHIDYIFRSGRQNLLKGPNKELLDLDFRTDGDWLAGASKDGNLYLWDFNNFEELTKEQRQPIRLSLDEGYPTKVAFVPGGYLVSAGTNQELRVWHTNSLVPGSVADFKAHEEDLNADLPFLDSFVLDKHNSIVQDLVLSPNEKWLASVDQSGEVFLWDTSLFSHESSLEEAAIEIDLNGFPLVDVEFSSSGEFLALSDVTGSVFLLDLKLTDDPYEFTNSRLVLQHYGKMVYDLAFDKPIGTNPKHEYLFAAGPQKTIKAFNLNDLSAPPITFPFAHEGTPQFLTVSRDPGNIEFGRQYWLTSLDDKGIAVFWNLNRLLGYSADPEEENYHVMQLTNNDPIGLSGNLTTGKVTMDTGRNLIIAESPDRSVRVVNLSADPKQWEFTQLRSLFGKVKDAVLRNDNHYIASTANNKVRVWDVDRVSNFENAIPWRAWLFFLFPLILIYLFILQNAGTYIMRAYGLASRELALMYLLNAMFGYSFETFWKFLLSLLIPIYPQARVVNGMLERDPDRFDYVDSIGGPGRIHVRPGNVVAFQTNRMQTNVVTNLTYWLRPFERVRNIISLDDQFFEEKEIETYTRDGIKVIIRDIKVRYRIPHTTDRAEWQSYRDQFIATGETAERRKMLQRAFDSLTKDNVISLVTFYNLTSAQEEFLTKVKELIEQDKLLYFNRGPNEYGNVDREALKKAINILNWAMAVEKPLLKRIRYFVNRKPLDYFNAPDRFKTQKNDQPNGWFRTEFREQVIKEMNMILKAIGAEVLWMDVGAFEVSKKEIGEAHTTLWQWRNRIEAEKTRALGEAAKEKARIEGRLAGEKAITEKLISSIQKLHAHFEGNGGLSDPERRAVAYSQISGLLRKYLRKAKSDGSPPDPRLKDKPSRH